MNQINISKKNCTGRRWFRLGYQNDDERDFHLAFEMGLKTVHLIKLDFFDQWRPYILEENNFVSFISNYPVQLTINKL